jgi:hypothetical protein
MCGRGPAQCKQIKKIKNKNKKIKIRRDFVRVVLAILIPYQCNYATVLGSIPLSINPFESGTADKVPTQIKIQTILAAKKKTKNKDNIIHVKIL